MKPPWLMHEERIAYHLNGRRVPGSGSGYRKGDIWIGKDWMIECKTTQKPKYRLSVTTLDKLAKQSLQAGLSAALLIIFHRGYTDFDRYPLVLTRTTMQTGSQTHGHSTPVPPSPQGMARTQSACTALREAEGDGNPPSRLRRDGTPSVAVQEVCKFGGETGHTVSLYAMGHGNGVSWKSITLTPEMLEQGITLASRDGIWHSMKFEEFMDIIKE